MVYGVVTVWLRPTYLLKDVDSSMKFWLAVVLFILWPVLVRYSTVVLFNPWLGVPVPTWPIAIGFSIVVHMYFSLHNAVMVYQVSKLYEKDFGESAPTDVGVTIGTAIMLLVALGMLYIVQVAKGLF